MAVGVRTINISLKIGQNITDAYLQEVLYVPDLQGNLFSVNKMIDLGNKVTFDRSGCTIKDKRGKMIAIVTKVQNLYQLNTDRIPSQATLDAQTNSTDLWHR